MAILRTICLAFVVGCMLTSCDKDDDGNEPLPGELRFSGFSEVDMQLYVAGEQRDASSLDLTRLFNATRRSWISESYYFGHYYLFEGDSLQIDHGSLLPERYGYFFRNDSLFALMTYPFFNMEPTPIYLATGDKTALYARHCLSYIRTYEDGQSVGYTSSLNVSAYDTPDDMVGYAGFNGLELMGPNDTLLLINQTKVYK